MSELVERLRAFRGFLNGSGELAGCAFGEGKPFLGRTAKWWWRRTHLSVLDEAADTIERLEAENARKDAALKIILGDEDDAGTWHDAVQPLVARFDTAAKFGADAVHNGKGAEAISKLMATMAARLDTSVERARQALTGETPHE